MTKKPQALVLVGLCLGFSWPTFGNLEKADLYEAVLAAPTRQADERQQLFQDGLEIVLKRISGDSELLKNKEIISALESSGQYVEKFGYYGGQSLFVRYNPNTVNELVLEANQPIWGQKRPTVLLWLAISEDSLDRRIIGAESDPKMQVDIKRYASELGLPLVLPIMDLTDMRQVNASDVWGEFPSVLHRASKRYDADVIVVAKIQKNHNDVWASQWQFMVDDYVQKWDWTSEERDSAIQEGVSQLARHLLQRYGLKKGQQTLGSILVGVQDIASISDFAKAEAYLNSLEQLDVVNVKEVTNQGVIFEVTTMGHGDPEILSQVISMDNKLVTLADKDRIVENTDLTYRLVESLQR
tara:strand:- start:88316 stop:89380 length:1065 start_codon:yes stop_codon:yes gene_type:complete